MRRSAFLIAAAVAFGLTAAGVLPSPPATGETVTLADGSTRTITVTYRDRSTLRGVEDGEAVEIAGSKVRKVDADKNRKQAMDAKLAALSGAPPPSNETLLWVADWAVENGFKAQASLLFRRVLAGDPENVAAHRGLGHFLAEGAWYSSETEWRATKGEVPYRFGEYIAKATLDEPDAYCQLEDGQWVTAAEFADLEAGKPLIGPSGSGVPIPGGEREKGWTAVITRHYRIDAELKVSRLRTYASSLEAAYQYFKGYYPFEPTALPLRGRGFNSAKAMQQWYLKNRHYPMAENTNGFFCGLSGELLFAYVKDDETTEEVLVHEATHQFEGYGKPGLYVGTWYGEGLPCFHSHFTKKSRRIDGIATTEYAFGALNPKHNFNLVFMAKHSWAGTVWDVEDILRGRSKRDKDNENRIDPDIYHHAWCFTYFLKTCKEPPIADAFAKWEAEIWELAPLQAGQGVRLLKEHLSEWWPKIDEHFKGYVAELAKSVPKGKYK